MELHVYQKTRQQLIDLYYELDRHPVPMIIPPALLMTNKEIEQYEHFTKEDTFNLGNDLHEPTIRMLTVSMLSDVIHRNPENLRDFGFKNPEDCLGLYRSIVRYLELWMDIANNAQDLYLPPIKELYALEEVLLWVFHSYSEIFLYRINSEAAKRKLEKPLEEENPFLALARLGIGAYREVNPDTIKFRSILDDRLPDHLKSNLQRSSVSNNDPDSVWELELSKINNLLG